MLNQAVRHVCSALSLSLYILLNLIKDVFVVVLVNDLNRHRVVFTYGK